MKKGTNILFVLTIFLVAVSCQQNTKKEIYPTNDIDSIIENWLYITGIPSISIVFIKDSKIFESKAYGYSNLKGKSLATVDTYYNTGSNFKSVTATAILQLEERGLIDIDKSVNDYLKQSIDYFNNDFPITARHLMSHVSGIPSSVGLNKVWERGSNHTLKDIVATIKPNYKPGEKYQYSNDGYSLLGLLIEDITGLTYEDYIWKNILKPLEIETYGFLNPSAEMIEDLAFPYHMRYNKAYPTNHYHIDQYPAGDIFLKPADMAKFLIMHSNNGKTNTGNILSSESVKKMHEPSTKVEENFYYGFGFGIDEKDDKKYSVHQGSLPGYLSAFKIDLESKHGIYIATNVSSSPMQDKQIQAFLNYLFEYIANPERLDQLEIPTVSKSFDESSKNTIDLTQYTGKYQIADLPFYFYIDKIGNQLFLINPENKRFRIDYLNETDFFLTTENEDLLFTVVDQTVESLTLVSGENRIVATKNKE